MNVKLFVMITDTEYKEMQEALMKLPIRKRKNYKHSLTDKWGVKTKVVFKDETFYNWSTIHHQWVRVMSQTETFNSYEEVDMAKSKRSAIGEIGFQLWKFKQENPEIDTDAVCNQVLQKHRDMTHTGNHYRNHYIKVPGGVYGNHAGTH